MDERDVVSLYPLDTQDFPLTPAMNNGSTSQQDVQRPRHLGLSGRQEVASRIYDALTAP